MSSYKDLDLWRVSVDFALEIYKITNNFPKKEDYGIVSQMRRAAVSIPSNIAEGCGRKNAKEFIQFLYVAKGSLYELETQAEIAYKLGYFNNKESIEINVKRIYMMIIRMIERLSMQSSRK